MAGNTRQRCLNLIVLIATLGVAGCQTSLGERPPLPLLRPIEASQLVRCAMLGPPSLPDATYDLHEVLRSCYERDQVIDLENALRMAHGSNPTIGLADEIVQAHRAERMLARSLLFPTLNVGTTLSIHRGALLSGSGVLQDVNRESLYFGSGADVRGAGTVAVPGLQIVGNLGDAIYAPRVADLKVTSGQFSAAATRNNVLLEVAKSYLALVGAEAKLLAQRQSESEFAEVARLTANFAAVGTGKEADAQRAKSELALVQSNAQALEEDVVVGAAELSRWLSADPAIRLRPEPGMPPLIQLVDDRAALESLMETALASRPEIAARNFDVARNETRLRQERVRPLVPTIAVGVSAGDFGGGSNVVGYRFSHFSGRTDIDVLAVWTLQNMGFGNLAVQNKVRAEIGQAEAFRIAMMDQVRREVAEALAQTKANRQQMEIARRRVESAQAAYRQDLARNKDPQLGRVIEVLRSLNLLATARQDLVQTMVNYSRAQFQLYVAIGGMPEAKKE